MYVIDSENGRKVSATVNKLDSKEITSINENGSFLFNWSLEIPYEVYKLTAEGIDGALGLISIEKRSKDYAFQIRLLACSKENVGNKKRYQRIAGCLIAFVCKESFKAGFGGYVCLKPKIILKTITRNCMVLPTQNYF